MARPEKARLGEILVQQKLLTQDQLKLALDEQKRSGRKLGRVFIEQGFVTEEEISEALAKQLQIPYINLKYYNIKPEVTQKLPETQARRFRAILLEDNAKAMKVGLADPTDLNAYDEIARILKREIEITVVTESQLLTTIDRSILRCRHSSISDYANCISSRQVQVSSSRFEVVKFKLETSNPKRSTAATLSPPSSPESRLRPPGAGYARARSALPPSSSRRRSLRHSGHSSQRRTQTRRGRFLRARSRAATLAAYCRAPAGTRPLPALRASSGSPRERSRAPG